MSRYRTTFNDYSEGFGNAASCSECGADLIKRSELHTGYCDYCAANFYDEIDEYDEYDEDLDNNVFDEDFAAEWDY